MKRLVLWVLLLVIGRAAALMLISFSTKESLSVYPVPDMALTRSSRNGTILKAINRKLKENGYASSPGKSDDAGNENLEEEDYHPINLVPSSKASIRPGPIQHGTPLMPYIPKPSPPGPPKHGGFP